MNDLTPQTTHLPIADRMRAEWANTLAMAIAECHPHDAAQIMTAALEDMQIGGPQGPSFGAVRQDAEWWADTCPQHELQEYAYAAMKVLAGRALGRTARLRFLAALWNGVAPDDKKAFLSRVGAA